MAHEPVRRARPACLAALALACAAAAAPAAAAPLHYRSIDYPGAAATEVFAVNDRRQFVGAEREPDGTHYALLDDGTGFHRLDLSALGATDSMAYSINGSTDVAGTFKDAGGHAHGYVHHADGTIETLDYPGGHETQGYGINDRGTVIGQYTDDAGVVHAYVRIRGEYADIDIPGGTQTFPLSVNDSDRIVGEFDDAQGAFGFVREPSGRVSLHTAPGSPPGSTFFISIDNRGGVLGAWVDGDGNDHNFLRSRGRYRGVDLPASFQSQFTSAQTINDLDDIVGYYVGADGIIHGWLGFSGIGR